MANSLSNLANDLSEGIKLEELNVNRIKCKFGNFDKKCEPCGITCKVCDCFF